MERWGQGAGTCADAGGVAATRRGPPPECVAAAGGEGTEVAVTGGAGCTWATTSAAGATGVDPGVSLAGAALTTGGENPDGWAGRGSGSGPAFHGEVSARITLRTGCGSRCSRASKSSAVTTPAPAVAAVTPISEHTVTAATTFSFASIEA
ncbi:MAG TPA: hypothetical protein VFB66_07610, partial [Tepidisphaeraceae bacterium]|nr:hypothetical protein [Tepidisphaeraceae bacterium]